MGADYFLQKTFLEKKYFDKCRWSVENVSDLRLKVILIQMKQIHVFVVVVIRNFCHIINHWLTTMLNRHYNNTVQKVSYSTS